MSKSCTLVALLCLYFLIFSSTDAGLKVVEAKVCKRYSDSSSGVCILSSRCNSRCINTEKAKFGACHVDTHGRACFCYFNC
ncbi:hypothetical protein ARALYDRAFT_892869 [Arabidopsis lyrata subsp. lyrata]|uniref:Knottins-like domain-containing protein n=1 Tax=Arabidopsis lyrata subsp. lyrata TaxID=81972 RepID=D7KC44_ARALL|nr:hypothetical protein ARALYDRAFT_892869 [Arabidopsis lyrata subsp. lyrata]